MQDFVIPTEKVTWGKKEQHSLEVRGLSFQDFTVLFNTHGKLIEDLFPFIEGFLGSQPDGPVDGKAFGKELLFKAPEVVAHLIALAIDMPDRAVAARMPLPVQIRILEVTWLLTIEESGGLTDFFELLLRLIQSTKQGVHSMSLNRAQLNLDIGS